MLLSLVNWLENHTFPCLYKKLLGVDCPGCGMQRAIIELLKGDIKSSFIEFPALLPMMAMITYLILFLAFKFKNGLVVLKILFIFTSSLLVMGYLLKIVSFINR